MDQKDTLKIGTRVLITGPKTKKEHRTPGWVSDMPTHIGEIHEIFSIETLPSQEPWYQLVSVEYSWLSCWFKVLPPLKGK